VMRFEWVVPRTAAVPRDVHWAWGDGEVSEVEVLVEGDATVLVGVHRYDTPGIHRPALAFADDLARTIQLLDPVAVFEPGRHDLAACGHTGSAADPLTVALLVPGRPRARVPRAMAMVVESDDFRFVGEELHWLVTTNKGWAHLRGEGHLDGSRASAPFRADLMSAGPPPAAGPDRFALRVYEPGRDPNFASPLRKAAGDLVVGAVYLDADASR
jgi:hypothetical protein